MKEKTITQDDIACIQQIGESNLNIALLNDGDVLFIHESGAVIMGVQHTYSKELLQALIDVSQHLLFHIDSANEDHSHVTKH